MDESALRLSLLSLPVLSGFHAVSEAIGKEIQGLLAAGHSAHVVGFWVEDVFLGQFSVGTHSVTSSESAGFHAEERRSVPRTAHGRGNAPDHSGVAVSDQGVMQAVGTQKKNLDLGPKLLEQDAHILLGEDLALLSAFSAREAMTDV